MHSRFCLRTGASLPPARTVRFGAKAGFSEQGRLANCKRMMHPAAVLAKPCESSASDAAHFGTAGVNIDLDRGISIESNQQVAAEANTAAAATSPSEITLAPEASTSEQSNGSDKNSALKAELSALGCFVPGAWMGYASSVASTKLVGVHALASRARHVRSTRSLARIVRRLPMDQQPQLSAEREPCQCRVGPFAL
eukprot:gene12645-15880_t